MEEESMRIDSSHRNLFREKGMIKRLARRSNYWLSNHSFRGAGIIRSIINKFLIGFPKRTPVVCPVRYDFNLIIDPTTSESVDIQIYYKGAYEAGTIEVIKKCLRPGDTFIDVGGYIGLMSFVASECVGDNGVVYTFEPEPSTVDILKKNIAINGRNNIVIKKVALGSTRGKSLLYSNEELKGSATLNKDYQQNWKSWEVEVDTLDNFVSSGSCQVNAEKIRMIKIDVEGWEMEVLKGGEGLLGSKNAPILCFEYSPLRANGRGKDLVELFDFVTAVNSYRVYRLEKGKERPSKLISVKRIDQLPLHDNLFCFKSEHLATVPPSLFQHEA